MDVDSEDFTYNSFTQFSLYANFTSCYYCNDGYEINSQRKRAALWYGHDNAQVRYFAFVDN